MCSCALCSAFELIQDRFHSFLKWNFYLCFLCRKMFIHNNFQDESRDPVVARSRALYHVFNYTYMNRR
jgi:hypothetical protein